MSIGQDLLNVPMGEMIYSMASAIARSQLELDHASIESAEMMGGLKTITDDQGNVTFTDSRVFFGHDYMTLPEAMITQGEDNPVVKALMAGQSIIYRIQKTGATYLATDEATFESETIDVTIAGLKQYKDYCKTLAELLATLRADLAYQQSLEAPNSAGMATLKVKIDALLALDAYNKGQAASIIETQVRVPTRLSLLELGFAPVFYSFVDTIIEVKIAISITRETSSTTTTENTGRSVQSNAAFRGIPFLRAKMNRSREVSTSQVNASYSSRYSYSAEGSSLLRTKLTPVPTPAILEERIRMMMTADQQRQAAELAAMTTKAA